MKSNTLKLGLAALVVLMFAGCSDDGGSSSNGPSGEAVIANKTITGVSQKGPFVNGSSVTVQELDGKTLAQTGKSFKGKISNDKGEFSVANVTLASKYALLEANGYYWNENTGRQSAGPITLNALVDLSKRENVNINLLTHLEYERALHLLSTSKGVAAAKKQAEGEIFKAFGVAGDFANSEELDILAKGEGDAALLAISVLMQGNLTEAGLSERLANFADDIERDGTWDDAAAKAQMADWASTVNLATIRSTVEGWNAGSKAPAFEQAVKAFWWNEYGLGACTATNDGDVKQDTNSLSAYHDVNYVCDNGDWRQETSSEKDIESSCSHSKIGEEKLFAGYLVCSQSGVWTVSTHTVAGTMTDSRDGKVYKTVGIGSQTWMAENLNYEYKANDTTLVYNNSRCYKDSAKYCAKYGQLYIWYAAIDYEATGCKADFVSLCTATQGKVRGICPEGWHLPSRGEWEVLLGAVGGQNIAGKMLKTTSGWSDFDGQSGNGADAYGFSVRPSGLMTDWRFHDVGLNAEFWSSSENTSEHGGDRAYSVHFPPVEERAYMLDNYEKSYGLAVRCVKD